jgi:hypothetical protein
MFDRLCETETLACNENVRDGLRRVSYSRVHPDYRDLLD